MTELPGWVNPEKVRNERVYRMGQYLDSKKDGPKYSVVVYRNGEESFGHDILSFEELTGYLIGASEYPRDRASIRFINGGIDRLSPMGNKIEPIKGEKLDFLLKKLHLDVMS